MIEVKLKKYIRPKSRDLDFSLHDAKIINFEFDYGNNNLILNTDYGFVDIQKDKIVEGKVIIQDVSIEDSYVYLIDYKNVLCGNVGNFSGEKMTLDTFISAYPIKFMGFDLIGEYDGYRTFVMNGFMSKKGEYVEELEVWFEIDYTGNFIYIIEE